MDAYPMPRIDEVIDRLGAASFISTMDLNRGYWQVPITRIKGQNREQGLISNIMLFVNSNRIKL